MKKSVLSIFLILATAVLVHAQSGAEGPEPDWREVFPRHEVCLGIGDCAVSYLQEYLNGSIDGTTTYDWFGESGYYRSDIYTTCPIAFSYMYRVTKFLWLGGTFAYSGFYGQRYYFDGETITQQGVVSSTQLALMPSIRFSYLNNRYVTLYSGLSTGMLISVFNPAEPGVYTRCRFTGQLTGIGVKVGKNWFGYTELGLGYKGFIHAGFGYQFNTKTSQK